MKAVNITKFNYNEVAYCTTEMYLYVYISGIHKRANCILWAKPYIMSPEMYSSTKT
jgi:hypothetical protein